MVFVVRACVLAVCLAHSVAARALVADAVQAVVEPAAELAGRWGHADLPPVDAEAAEAMGEEDAIHIPLTKKIIEDKTYEVVEAWDPDSDDDDLTNSTIAMLVNHKTTQYIGTIFVGTPGQSVDMIWDTGSSNTWVYAEACKTAVCMAHHRYDHKASSSYTRDGTGMVIKYGSGDIEGYLSRDVVAFCRKEGPGKCTVFADDLKFGEVSWTTGDSFMFGQYDGIVGLGFPSLAIDGTTPPFDAMFMQKKFANPVFGFYMTHGSNEAGSTLTIGGVDKTKYTGEIRWHHLFVKDKTPEYWTLKLKDVHLDGVPMGLCKPGGCPIAIDTGTSLITGPSSMVRRLITTVNVDPDCKTEHHTLPRIGMEIDDHIYNLDPEDYVIKVDDDGSAVCLGGFRDLDLPPEKGPLWIAGDVFLRRYYSVYDRNSLKVGLADSKRK